MTERKTIKQWQKASYDNAVAKGFHDCKVCDGEGYNLGPCPYSDGTVADGLIDCDACNGTGRAPLTPTRIGSRLALIHCEISEAVECVARGRMELYFVGEAGESSKFYAASNGKDDLLWVHEGFKPEGFSVELADVFLRLADLAESLGFELQACAIQPCAEFNGSPEHIAAALNDMHSMCSQIRPNDPEELALTDVLYQLVNLAAACGVDLLAMVELKHAYNVTRPLMHGGKIL